MSDLDPPAPPPEQPITFEPPPDFNLQGKKSKLPFIIIGVLVAAGGGYLIFNAATKRGQRKVHAQFMERFASVEKEDVGAFWACLVGPNLDPGMFQDNLKFGEKVDQQFFQDPKNFPDKVIDDCVPRLKGLGDKARSLDRPSGYDEALDKYAKSLDELAVGAKDWAEGAKKRLPEREADKRVEQAGTAFHSAAPGKAGADAIAYERFLRCAVPDIGKVKDEQGLLEKLFEECKKPDYVQHVRFECSKLAAGSETKEDKNYKEAWKKFAPDDRDIQAFADCFKKGRKGAKRDDMAALGKAWKDYMDASGEVRKLGAANLKED